MKNNKLSTMMIGAKNGENAIYAVGIYCSMYNAIGIPKRVEIPVLTAFKESNFLKEYILHVRWIKPAFIKTVGINVNKKRAMLNQK